MTAPFATQVAEEELILESFITTPFENNPGEEEMIVELYIRDSNVNSD